MKKTLLAVAAVAMPVGMIASTASVAGAGGKPTVDVSNASITCTSVTGEAKFAPTLDLLGGKPENTNIKLAMGGCTVSGVPGGVTIASGKGAGVLHSASNLATDLLGATAVTGQVNIKWKASGAKLTSKMSTVTVTFINGGTSPSTIVGTSYASLAVMAGNASVSGDFTGGDSGAGSTLYAETTQTVATLTTDITPPSKGIKLINLGTDATHTVSNSLHLG